MLPAVIQRLGMLVQIALERRVVQHRKRHLEVCLRVILDGLGRFCISRRFLRLYRLRFCLYGFRYRLRFRLHRRTCKRAGRQDEAQNEHKHERIRCHIRLFCDKRNALSEALFPQLHRRCAGQQLALCALRRDEAEQCAAVACPAAGVEVFQHPLVAGQFAVAPGKHGRKPHDGVEPVQALADEAQEAPKLVFCVKMRQFVPEDKAAGIRLRRSLWCEIYFGAEQPHKARRRQSGRQPDRNRTLHAGKRLPNFSESPEKPQILRQNNQRHRCRAGQPDQFQNRASRQLRLRLCGRSFRFRCSLCWGVRIVRLRGTAIFRGSQPLHGGGHVRDSVHHADRTSDQRDRQQKPQRGEQPQCILQARIDFPAQQKAKCGQRKDQNGR